MREFLRVDKTSQTIESKLVNNTSKLTEIDECIKRDGKKLKEGEDDPTYSEEKRQLYKLARRLDDLNTEK